MTTGLALLSGVYFPVEVFPAPIEALAHLAYLVASAAVTLPLSLLLFRTALDRVRRSGSLAHY